MQFQSYIRLKIQFDFSWLVHRINKLILKGKIKLTEEKNVSAEIKRNEMKFA
jgi:hypothetical protein